MKTVVRRIIDYSVQIASPELVILFGSVNKGNYNAGSDIDILIVSDNNYSKAMVIERVTTFIKGFSLGADVIICTNETYADALNQPLTFLGSIIKSGTVYYKK